MANETILAVDDAPVNLKLTDTLLRKEGYKVHATSNAEQELSLLRSVVGVLRANRCLVSMCHQCDSRTVILTRPVGCRAKPG